MEMEDNVPVSTPFGTKPTDVKSPVPNKAQAQDALAELDALDSLAQLDPQTTAPAEDAMPPMDDIVAPEDQMSPLPAPTGIDSAKEQLNEAYTRLKNAFTVTDFQSIDTLKQSGLFNDVRLGDNGKVQVKRKGRQGWEDFDRDKAELLGDSLDLSRDIFEGVIENSMRIGGAIGGALVGAGKGVAVGAGSGTLVAPGPGTVIGGVTGGVSGGMAGAAPGGIMGGAIGAATAKNAGDFVAEELFGIVKDPDRNKAKETAVAAAYGAGFNWLGSRVARLKAAKEARTREAKRTLDYAKTQADTASQLVEEVKNSGIKLGDNGHRFYLDPQQAVGKGNIPDLDITATELSRNLSFQNFRREQGQMLASAYDDVANAIGASSGRAGDLGADFVLSAKDIRKAQGKLIESFRDLADEKLVGQKRIAPRTAQVAANMFQQIGGKIENTSKKVGYENVNLQIKQTAEDLTENVMRLHPALTATQAKTFAQEVIDLNKKLLRSGNNLSVDEAQFMYDSLSAKINRSINSSSGRPYAMALLDLKNSVRDDWTDMMGEVLPDAHKAMYAKSKQRYSEMMKATERLGGLLQNEDISRGSLISSLFEGKNSLKLARGAKTLIQESNPGLWQDLTGGYLQKLKSDNIMPNGQTNWNAINQQWQKIGPEMQQEILDGSGFSKEGMNALLALGNKYKNADFQALPQSTKIGKARALFNLFGPTMASTKGDAATSLLEGIGSEQSMMIWLKDGGLEEVLHKMPGLKPDMQQRMRSWIADWTPKWSHKAANKVAKQVEKVPESLRSATSESAVRAARTYSRRSIEEGELGR